MKIVRISLYKKGLKSANKQVKERFRLSTPSELRIFFKKEEKVNSTLIHSNDVDFETVVLGSKEPVLVDFWAEWCGPCHMIAPMVDQLATEHTGNLRVVKVNIDESPEVAQRYGIMSIPTLVVFDKGTPVEGTVGVVPFESLNKWISGLLEKFEATDHASA